MAVSLFDKYGGVPTVTRIVKDFHERLMRRPNLRRYFEEMEVDSMIQHHIAYVSYAMGKPNQDFTMKKIHDQHMQAGVTKASFNHVTEIFLAVLDDEGVSPEDMKQIEETLKAVRGEIVSKGLEK
jgi:hemoglobin